ncbi:MAG: amidase [Candidimonas sp.]|nr:MAG: amidase [Candidimonas sp.]TAM23590.1 MAG: amidase [Candidimonas sp.]TAM77310.1 MAG: amidase [Candidimonas sp.]
MKRTLSQLAEDLSSGRTTSRTLVEECLNKIDAPNGEGSRAFVKVDRDAALAAAVAMDELRAVRLAPSAYAGIPISVKDLFDLTGDPTPAGSTVLAHSEPAVRDALAIARLRRAGFVVVGRTNMTEFAFSGVGLNPHYGTPAAPFDRATRRIPGGSSSGAGVSISDGMAYGAIGSDTGGSCRIPAALCGVVGYKPTAATIPCEGAFPLSQTLDSIGSIANSVACCRVLHYVMSGQPLTVSDSAILSGLRIGVPQAVALDDMDTHVAACFEQALSTLSRAGATLRKIPFQSLVKVAHINRKGGFAAAEAYAVHRALLASAGDKYDPRVKLRIERGRNQDCADYIDLVRERKAFVAVLREEVSAFDVIAMPTVPIIAPPIESLEKDDDVFTRTNLLMLRNPTLINMMDGCAISLPMHAIGQAPAGLMLAKVGGEDDRLFAIAAAVETTFAETL